MSFSVIHFLSTDDVSVASSHWINPDKTTCMWPPYKEVNKVKRAVLEHKSPESTWMSYEVVVIGTYSNYLTAEIRCRKALDTSCLDADGLDVQEIKVRREDEPLAEKTVRLKSELSNSSNTNHEHSELSESSGDESVFKKAKKKICLPITTVPVEAENNIHLLNRTRSNDSEIHEYKLESFDVSVLEAQSNECEKTIIRKLDEVIKVQKEHSFLLRQLVPSIPLEIDSVFMPKLPADNFLELDEWEGFLSDSTSFNNAVLLFGSKVGNDVNNSTRRLLCDMITNKLAANFNWAGKPPKRSFKDLKTMSLILCAIKTNKNFKSVDVGAVQNVIKGWLRHAPYRYHYGERKKS